MPSTAELPRHPMLRHDVAFLQMQDGLLVKAQDNTFKVRGSNAYQYVSALLPFLDGHHQLDHLLDGLSDAHGDTVRSLLSALHTRGIIINRVTPALELPTPVVDRYSDQLALLVHYGDAHAALRRIATHRVLVVGPDQRSADMMATSLQDNGFGALTGRVTTHLCVSTDLSQGTLPDLHDTDLVVLVSPDRRFHGAGDLSAAAVRAGAALVGVVRVGETVVIGPWQTDQPLLQHAAVRMTDNGIAGAAELLLPAVAAQARLLPEPQLPDGAVDLPVSMCAFEIFKLVSGVMTSELSHGVVFFDPERLETTSETLIPHPLLEGAPPRAIPSPSGSRSTTDMDDRLAAFTPLVNDHVGLARRFHDDDVPQIPVKIGVLDAPVLGADPVIGYSIDNVASARVAALNSFAARYSLTVLGRRVLPDVDPHLPSIAPAQITTFLSPEHDETAWLTATSLDDEAVRVPARAVLASPLHRRGSSYHPGLDGLGAGADLAAAREESLLSAICGWTTQQVLAGHLTVTAEEELGNEADDPTTRLLLNAARTLGAPAQLWRVQGAVLPSVLVVTSELTILKTAHTWWEAARSALVETVGTVQLARHLGRPPTAPQPHLSAGVDAIRISTAIPSTQDAASAQESLLDVGLGAAWVDITSPDLDDVTRIVRTVLFRDDR